MHKNGTVSNSKIGITLLRILVFSLFCIIVLRLWYFQIYRGEEYTQKAQDNILRQHSIHAPRGLIRDRKGKILAEDQPAYGLALVREDCENISETLTQVSKWTQIPLSKLEKRFEKDKKKVKAFKPQLLVSNLSFQEVAKIKSHLIDWPSLQIKVSPLRFYPKAPILSHVLGYVAQANEKELRENSHLQLGDKVGKQGLELTLDNILRGEKGLKQVEVNAQGRELQEKVLKQPTPGKDITITIDLDLQKYIWDQLGNQTGSVVVLDPDQGKILSLVSKPGYDNNLFVQGLTEKRWKELISDPKHPLQNRAIQSGYPPGSVFKLVISSCALLNNIITPEKRLYCPGKYRLGRRVFNCWKERGHGWMDMQEAIKQSCDVYFYKLGEKLGIENISDFAQKYGFEEKTNIILPGENKGLIPDKQWKKRHFGTKWQGGETLNTAIGQGYTLVTPIQVARYVVALLNGGYLLKPILLQNKSKLIQNRLPISESECQLILKAMIAAVEEPHGTAWRLRTPGVTVGGKTGTAQVVKLIKKYKDEDLSKIPYRFRDHAWMASFATNGEKNYVVVVLVEHGGHGSSGAGPIVKDIYDYLYHKD